MDTFTRNHRWLAMCLMALTVIGLTAAGCGGPATQAPAKPTEPPKAAAPEVPFVATITARQSVTVDTSQYKKDPPYRIALAAQGPTNAWGTLFDAHARDTVEKYGTDVIVDFLYADSNGNADKQVNDVEDLLAQKPDALILTPMGKAALSGPTERATAQGVPVILCASGVDTDNFVSEVGHNLYDMGAKPMEWLATQINGQGNIIVLGGIPGVDTAETMLRGADDVLAKYPNVKVVGRQYTNWSTTEAKKATEAFIAANPRIDGVWAGGGQQAIGAIDAFKSAGKTVPPIAAGEAQNGFLRIAKENNVAFYAFQYPPSMSKVCVDIAVKVLKGEPVQKYYDVYDLLSGMTDFTEKDIAEYYKPEYNDDLIVPYFISEDKIKALGFER